MRKELWRSLHHKRQRPPFRRDDEVGRGSIRTIVLYFLIMVGLRLLGKRQIGELEPIELVLTLLISDLAAVPMQDFGIPLLNGVIRRPRRDRGTTRREEDRIFGGCFPAPVGAPTAGKHAGDRRTKGL